MTRQHAPGPASAAAELLHRGALLLALTLVAVKVYHLGDPTGWLSWDRYLRAVPATSFLDVVFVLGLWVVALAALLPGRRRPRVARTIGALFLGTAAVAALYAVASVVMFDIFGGFLTYSLLTLVGDLRMVRSSVVLHLTPGVAAGLVLLPLAYIAAVLATDRVRSLARPVRVGRWAVSVTVLLAWIAAGHYAYEREWATRQDRRIAENAHWVLASSMVRAAMRDDTVRLADSFGEADLVDFTPPAPRAPAVTKAVRVVARSRRDRARAAAPPSVILVVLEAVAARWTSLGNARYDTTPTLGAEARHALVFDNFYAHIGRSSNSLAAMLLSTYPKLDFQDVTAQYPRLGGTSLAARFREHGYRTSFVTPSDLQWAGWKQFIAGRGFDRVRDHRDLACGELVSSWGVADRCMVDDLIALLREDRGDPFFMMAWSQQTHHPYEPSPGTPALDLVREPGIRDRYDLGRYLNVLHETDAQLARMFAAVRAAGLADNTLIVVTGDHGQAFGYPHNTYIQGRTIYEEDVNVPLMLWLPARFRGAARPAAIGSHVDLAPTIAELAGLPPAADWQGRSLFDASRAPRAYFYVAEDHFRLGVREGVWKYIYDLREGSEELYRLDADPTEQRNLAASEPARCARLRQRLSAWAEANRRQYGSAE